MVWGTPHNAGIVNTETIDFRLPGADTANTIVTLSTETALSLIDQGSANEWVAPWPCLVTEVFSQMEATGPSVIRFRVRKHLQGAATHTDVISNAISGSATDYIDLAAVTGTLFQTQRYVGIPEDDMVGTADGWHTTAVKLAAGDALTATYTLVAQGDVASHVHCKVTVARIDNGSPDN